MITDINHSGIVVPDLEIAIDFYTNIMKLVLVEIRERDGSGISQVLGYENTHIKVADVSTPTGQIIESVSYTHLTLPTSDLV